MEDFFSKYNDWFFNKSNEEAKLFENILEYEQAYFKDMTIDPDGPLSELAYLVYELFDNFPLTLSSYSYTFQIKTLDKGVLGICDSCKRTIIISEENKNKKDVILHEMIHAYEYIIESTLPILKEAILIYLYKKLSSSIKNLDNLICDHAELYGQYKIMMDGGLHGILFYLKSLELDMQCGYKLGTICGYGRDSGEMYY